MKRFTSLVIMMAMLIGLWPTAALAAGEYDDVGDYDENGLARVWKGEKVGAVDASGREVLPPRYDFVWFWEPGFISAERKEGEKTLKGLFDREGKELLPVAYEGIWEATEGLRLVKKEGRYSYLDESLQTVLSLDYTFAQPFHAGLAEVGAVSPDGRERKGVIDRTGREVLPCVYDSVNIYDDGVICAGNYWEKEEYGLFDREGNVLLPMEYDWITTYNIAWGDEDHHLYDDYFEVRKETPEGPVSGIADRRGNIVLPVEYERILRPDEERWIVTKKGKTGVLDGSFQTVIPLIYEDYMWDDGNSYRVRKNGRFGAVDRKGNVLIPIEYDTLWTNEGSGLCQVTQKGKAGVLSYPEGKVLVPLQFDEADPFVYDLPERILVKKDGLYGAYDWEGKELYPCRFASEAQLRGALQTGNADPDALGEESRREGLEVTWYPEWQNLTRLYGTDRMILVRNDLCALYGLDGTRYTDPVFDAIGVYTPGGQAAAMKNGKWGAVDLNGNTTLDFLYDRQELVYSALETGVKFVSPKYDGSTSYALATLEGKRLTDYKYWGINAFVNGYAWVADGENWTYLNTRGEEIVPFGRYQPTSEAFGRDGLARVIRWDGETHWENAIDGTGREIFPEVAYGIWRAGEGLWGYVDQETRKVGFLDAATGQVAIPPQYDYRIYMMRPGGMMGNLFRGGVAVVYSEDGEDGIYIDTKGNRVEDSVGEAAMAAARAEAQDPEQELTQSYHEGLRWVNAASELPLGDHFFEYGAPWGFQDETGKLVVPCIYDTVGYFDRGYATVTVNGVYGLLKNPLAADEDAHRVSPWAAAEVSAATEAGYVTPRCSTYQTHPITRLQFAELAVNYLEKKTGEAIVPAPADTFTDTDDEAVRKAYAAGIVQGVGEGRFDSEGLLTREQLATMLWRAMEQVGAGMRYGSMEQYTDAHQVSEWAAMAMNNLIHHGVMTGTGENTLSPKDSCTVEQAILLVYRAAGKEFTLPPEREAQHREALDRVTIEGIKIGMPFQELPPELLAVLEPKGDPFDAGVFVPEDEIGRRYKAPGIEIITSQAPEKVLKRVLQGQDKAYLLEYYGTESWEEVYAREKGREYVDTVILTGEGYRMASGLKVGDSGERARELGYHPSGEAYEETAGFDGSVMVSTENDTVVQIKVYDSIGRRIGAFFDP